MRDRTFGVEIEHGNPHGGEGYVSAQLSQRFPELFDRANYPEYPMTTGYDGSGVEARTPPLKGAQGFRTLRAVLEFLIEIGGYTTASDGMHVHFGAPEFVKDPRLVVLLAKNWVANEDLIEEFVNERRRGSYGSCPQNVGEVIDEIARRVGHSQPLNSIVGAQPARGALNLRSLATHGTIEIRLHEGTLDPDVAEAWIRFCIKFIDAAAEGRVIQTCATHKELFKAVPTFHRARKTLSSRALVAA